MQRVIWDSQTDDQTGSISRLSLLAESLFFHLRGDRGQLQRLAVAFNTGERYGI